ncbi:copper resistance D family protein [Silvibacterium dinghuense]|uniref:Copper resistance protein n=1 Tax=Silvibacterium dinghuense TaxID=1560006 RepID=A0A4Q1S9R1_9BACT|nr:CopD family protein [Silvibacterium dinghuense]RXS93717.1 copper resistance protein [Silvibacterium dinghuense]GGH07104.1 copper resistance protein [Silvibacterium dinghuense]
MVWFTQVFDLLSVLLRAFGLAFEALTLGGWLVLLLVAAPSVFSGESPAAARRAVGRGASWAALALLVVQAMAAAESAVELMTSSGMRFAEVASADFFRADVAIVVAALAWFVLLRMMAVRASRAAAWLGAVFALALLAGSVMLSHAPSQLTHRGLLVVLTAAHHAGSAAWIGAMPWLLIAMRRVDDGKTLHAMARRFSAMAMVAVVTLTAAGVGMAWYYVRSWDGLYGTAYGALLVAKIVLVLVALLLGASNWWLLRATRGEAQPVLTRLRRFSEAEIGLGFTAILLGASLTAQPPAVDIHADRLTGHELMQRFAWKTPLMTTPSFNKLSKRQDLKDDLEETSFTGGSENDAMDRAWSEYNHHWAGIIVLAAGLLALARRAAGQRGGPVLRPLLAGWPLLFIGLAVFILLRGDPDAWPLGPRPFWGSFAEAEVLEHRIFSVLITGFAVFEWAVETGRVRQQWAALVFPAMCAVGGAFLMTHSHALGEVKDETLVEMSHTAIAVFGVLAGWSRWVAIRLSAREGRAAAVLNWVWPVCLALVGLVLLDYREG